MRIHSELSSLCQRQRRRASTYTSIVASSGMVAVGPTAWRLRVGEKARDRSLKAEGDQLWSSDRQPSAMAGRIREVWSDNFEQEMEHVRSLIEMYPYVAMVGGRQREPRI